MTCATRFTIDKSCHDWVSLADEQIADLHDKYDTIVTSQHRPKRAAFDFLGNVAGDLFGVLDSRFRKEYESNIVGLISNEEHLLKLLKNQTSVVEKTTNILKNDESELARQSAQIANLTKMVSTCTSNSEAATFFSTTIAILSQNIAKFEKQLDTMAQVIFDCRKHHINHNLLPPKQMMNELEVIADHVRNKYLVPEGHDIYNIITVTPHVNHNQVLIHISIPLLRLDRFKIFRVVPIPFKHLNETWSISSEAKYLMVANNRQLYQFITDPELNDCLPYNGELICSGPHHWRTSRLQHCVWETFNQIPTRDCTIKKDLNAIAWFDVGENRWIFSTQNSQDLTFICEEKIFRETIVDSGIISLGNNCTVKGLEIDISSKKSYNGREMELLIPHDHKFHKEEIDLSNMMYSSNFTVSDFTKLRENIRSIKETSDLPFESNFHDLHHYISIYTILISLLLLFVLISRKINLFKKPIGFNTNSENCNQEEHCTPTPSPRENVGDQHQP